MVDFSKLTGKWRVVDRCLCYIEASPSGKERKWAVFHFIGPLPKAMDGILEFVLECVTDQTEMHKIKSRIESLKAADYLEQISS